MHAMEILLVDDQAVAVQVFGAIVRRTFPGANVHTAADLPEALQIASGQALDLVLLHLRPTGSGVESLQRFRKAFPSVPVIVLSVLDDAPRIRACLEAGARGFVPKTTGLRSLSGALRTVAAGGYYVPPHAEELPQLETVAFGY